MFNKKSFKKNGYQLNGKFKRKGYDWWWHSFTAYDHITKKEVPFFIEFFIINPGLSKEKIVLGQSKENKGVNKPSYLMIKCGAWTDVKSQLHRFIPLNEVSIKSSPIEIKGSDFYLSEDTLKGTVSVDSVKDGMMCDTGSMSFDLKINKLVAYNVGYGTSSLMRFLKGFEMYWHAEGMKSTFEGTIKYNGRLYDVIPNESYGYADKNWGSNFTTPWLWISSNNLYDHDTHEKLNNSVFDIGGGKPKAFGITFKDKLLGAYFIEGKEYEYNFSKFWHPSKTRYSFIVENNICHWEVVQEDKKSKIETTLYCKVEDMLFVNYEAPNGLKQHNKLYNGGNGYGTLKVYHKQDKKCILIKEIDIYNAGCEYGEFDK